MSTSERGFVLEVCVDSLESALAAKAGGATRLELCADLIVGGTTPSLSLLRAVKRETGLPVHALLRPRFGDFLYTEAEFSLMLEDAKSLINAGADAIVSGCLTAEGELDEPRLERLVEMAHAAGKRFTLHRAFDVCRDPMDALAVCQRLGVDTILTSGQAGAALEGLEVIKKLCKQREKIEILIGAGVNASAIKEITRKIPGAKSFHMSGKTVLESGMTYRKPGVSMGLPGISEFEIWRTDLDKIKEARGALTARAVEDYLALCAEKFWPEREKILPKEVTEKTDSVLAKCSGLEKKYLAYLLATLPLSDLTHNEPEFFLCTVREALRTREEFPWYEELPEELFLMDLLYPRVFDEELSDCRGLFREDIGPRVKGLALLDAVQEVNRWCAEHVTYRSTDDYTDSALRVYHQGYGRCGEESVFAVNAFRSVGIVARQLYAPWWSHCDDNHAWVEVWDGERWWYLGACEPAPVLDRGWFTTAAARAPLVHTHAFVAGSPSEWGCLFASLPEFAARVGEEGGVVCEEVTQLYGSGQAARVTVTVCDEDGKPVAGARVSFAVLNMANFREIAVRKTGHTGAASALLWEGSVLISAAKDGFYAEELFRVGRDEEVQEIILHLGAPGENSAPTCSDFSFYALPDSQVVFPKPLSAEQKAEEAAALERCAALRERWVAAEAEREKPDSRNGGALALAGRESVSLTGNAVLRLKAPEAQPALENKNFSLSRLEDGVFKAVAVSDTSQGETREFALPGGRYRLLTTVRLPNGDQLGRRWDLSLEDGGAQSVELSFRQAEVSDLVEAMELPPFFLQDRDGKREAGLELLAEKPFSLLCFLDPGREPTEHILNELCDAAQAVIDTGAAVHFVLKSPEAAGNATLRKALSRLPEALLHTCDFGEVVELLARRVYGEPEHLPVTMLANCKGECLYSYFGYNVGLAELLVRILHGLT